MIYPSTTVLIETVDHTDCLCSSLPRVVPLLPMSDESHPPTTDVPPSLPLPSSFPPLSESEGIAVDDDLPETLPTESTREDSRPMPVTQSEKEAMEQQSVLDEIASRFGGTKSKHDVLHALARTTILHRIPLPAPVVSIAQAHKDFRRERVLLNDVAFIPDKLSEQRCHSFVQTLDVLVARLMRPQFYDDPEAPRDSRLVPLPSVYDTTLFPTFESVRDSILQRACRTSAGADSFFTVQKMLCIEGTFMTQKTLEEDPPIHIDVFLAKSSAEDSPATMSPITPPSSLSPNSSPSRPPIGPRRSFCSPNSTAATAVVEPLPSLDLCCRTEVSNSFAIFDLDSVDEIMGDETQDPKPWLDVEAVVVDESNFRLAKHCRRLHLTVTCVETGVTYSSSYIDDPLHLHDRYGRGKLLSAKPTKVFKGIGKWINGSRSASLSTSGSARHSRKGGSIGEEVCIDL